MINGNGQKKKNCIVSMILSIKEKKIGNPHQFYRELVNNIVCSIYLEQEKEREKKGTSKINVAKETRTIIRNNYKTLLRL